MILDRALPGGAGLDQYDQARDLEDLETSLKKGSNHTDTDLEPKKTSFGEEVAGLNPGVEESVWKK